MSYRFARFDQWKASRALPSPSGVALEILRLTQSDTATIAQLAHALQADPALAGRLVKFANSAQCGPDRPTVAIPDAVKRLGFAVVRQLCLGFSVLHGSREGACIGFDYPRFWSRSLATALAAQSLSSRIKVLAPEESFTCGLLADIGTLAIASLHPERFSTILESGAAGIQLKSAERDAFGADHLELSAAMLEDWRLPAICVDAVFHSELPERTGFPAGGRAQQLCEIVSLARIVGQYFVADIESRKRIVPPMLVRAAALAIDSVDLAQMCDTVGEGWQRWGEVLGVGTGRPPRLDIAALPSAIPPAPATVLAGGASLSPAAAAAPMPLPPLKVIVVSDHEELGTSLCETLVGFGHRVSSHADAKSAIGAALTESPDVVIVDLAGEATGATSLCTTLRATSLGQHIYLLGTRVAGPLTDPKRGLDRAPVSGVDAGPDDFLCLPVDAAMLDLRLRAARRALVLRNALQCSQGERRKLEADLEVASRRVQRAALTDALTGLGNRKLAYDCLAQAWGMADPQHKPLSCLVIGTDHFRRMNTLLGPGAADQALSALAATLRESVPPNYTACRIGGDEFMVIAPQSDHVDAVACAERLCAAIERGFGATSPTGQAGAPLTLSIGVATRDSAVREAWALARLAEGAMQVAKREGRNRVRTAGPDSPRPAAR